MAIGIPGTNGPEEKPELYPKGMRLNMDGLMHTITEVNIEERMYKIEPDAGDPDISDAQKITHEELERIIRY